MLVPQGYILVPNFLKVFWVLVCTLEVLRWTFWVHICAIWEGTALVTARVPFISESAENGRI